MSLPLWFSTHPVVHAVGLGLLHGLWQGVAIAAGAAFLLRAIDPAASARRHAVLLAALVAQVALFALTVALVHDGGVTAIAAASDPAAWRSPADPDRIAGGAALSRGVDVAFRTARPALPWVVIAWGLGAAFLALRLLAGARAAARVRDAADPAPDALRARATALAGRIGLRRGFRVRTTRRLDTPAAIGWWRPAVLLPEGIDRRLSGAELDALLMHELAHLRRRDDVVAVVQAAAMAALFHHPLAWWLSDRLTSEREHRCDDLVAGSSGDVVAYVRALIGLEERRGPALSTLHATSGALAARVRRLVEPASRPTPRRLAAGFVGATALAVALSGSQWLVVPAVPATPPGWATIRAVDDAGRFTVVIEAGRVGAVAIEGEALPPDRFVQRGDSLYVLDASGGARLSARIRPEGGMNWSSRPPGWRLDERRP